MAPRRTNKAPPRLRSVSDGVANDGGRCGPSDCFRHTPRRSGRKSHHDGTFERAHYTNGLLRNNLVTFLNASCSELWVGYDRCDPHGNVRTLARPATEAFITRRFYHGRCSSRNPQPCNSSWRDKIDSA